MGTFFKMLKFLTSISVLVSISYGVKEQDKTIDLTTLIGAGAGAAAGSIPGGLIGSIPGGLIGNGLGSLAGNSLFQNDPLLSGLTGLAGTGAGVLAGGGAGALTGAGIGAATGAVAAPAVAGVIDDVLGGKGGKGGKEGKGGKGGKEGKGGKSGERGKGGKSGEKGKKVKRVREENQYNLRTDNLILPPSLDQELGQQLLEDFLMGDLVLSLMVEV